MPNLDLATAICHCGHWYHLHINGVCSTCGHQLQHPRTDLIAILDRAQHAPGGLSAADVAALADEVARLRAAVRQALDEIEAEEDRCFTTFAFGQTLRAALGEDA